MNFDLRKYVIAAFLTVLVWILALTPLGYIPLFGIDVTILCIPIIIGTCALGLQYGLFLGLMFALTSLFMALMGRGGGLLAPLLDFPLILYPMIFVPRLLIPLVTWFAFKATSKWNQWVSFGVSALVGSFVNTIFFLGMAYGLGAKPLMEAYGMSGAELMRTLGSIVVSNGLPEAAVAVLVCAPALVFLTKMLAEQGEEDAEQE